MKPLWRQRRANLEAARGQNLVSIVGLGGAWRTPRGRDRPDGGAARRATQTCVDNVTCYLGVLEAGKKDSAAKLKECEDLVPTTSHLDITWKTEACILSESV